MPVLFRLERERRPPIREFVRIRHLAKHYPRGPSFLPIRAPALPSVLFLRSYKHGSRGGSEAAPPRRRSIRLDRQRSAFNEGPPFGECTPDSVGCQVAGAASRAYRLVERRYCSPSGDIAWLFSWNPNNRGPDDDPTNTETYGWDNHHNIFDGLQHHLLPRLDQSFSAPSADLDQRGLLSATLVIGRGELGPWDVTATVFSALGIDPATHDTAPFGRPYAISDGQVMQAVYR